MAYDEATAARVRRLLSRRRHVVEKRMVGGLSFIVNGAMCCGVTGAALMVRVDPAGRERALAEPHARPMKFAGRALAGFICVDPPGFRTERALVKWIRRALTFVATIPRARSARRRPTRTRRPKPAAG